MAIFGTKIDETELAELIELAIRKEVSTSMNAYLKEFRHMVDEEVMIIKETATKVNGLEELNRHINENRKLLNSMQEDFQNMINNYQDYIISLQDETARLQKEVRKRDSVLERKNTQIRKLKNEI
jgi:predicted nuclease with TOPRIM domain